MFHLASSIWCALACDMSARVLLPFFVSKHFIKKCSIFSEKNIVVTKIDELKIPWINTHSFYSQIIVESPQPQIAIQDFDLHGPIFFKQYNLSQYKLPWDMLLETWNHVNLLKSFQVFEMATFKILENYICMCVCLCLHPVQDQNS